MAYEYFHPKDEILLLYAGGELPGQVQMEGIACHIAGCPDCETRLNKLTAGLGDFSRAQREAYDSQLPSAQKGRAALISCMAEAEAAQHNLFAWSLATSAWRGYALGAVLLIAISIFKRRDRAISRRPTAPALLYQRALVAAGNITSFPGKYLAPASRR
jgi:hypothetical protein